ncbi:MAG: hypothetical protein WDA25_09850 [Paracoccaceae bacterium]
MPGISDSDVASGAQLALCAYLDIDGDPARAALAPVDVVAPAISILAAPDSDFDGQTFSTIGAPAVGQASAPLLVRIDPITLAAGGGEGMRVSLSGALQVDADILNTLADASSYFGRRVAFWQVALNSDFEPIAGRLFYSGKMVSIASRIGRDAQTLSIDIEDWRALLGSGVPARTVSQQTMYDPDDHVADAIIGKPPPTAFGPGAFPNLTGINFNLGIF